MVSQSAFGRLAHISPRAVRKAIQDGRLVAVGTTLDPEDPTNAAYIAMHQPGAAGIGGRAAQLGALIAKANLTRHTINETEAQYLDRTEVAERWAENARQVQARLATLPERQAGWLATELNCPIATARSILDQFTEALHVETKNFEEQAIDTILQLR